MEALQTNQDGIEADGANFDRFESRLGVVFGEPASVGDPVVGRVMTRALSGAGSDRATVVSEQALLDAILVGMVEVCVTRNRERGVEAGKSLLRTRGLARCDAITFGG